MVSLSRLDKFLIGCFFIILIVSLFWFGGIPPTIERTIQVNQTINGTVQTVNQTVKEFDPYYVPPSTFGVPNWIFPPLLFGGMVLGTKFAGSYYTKRKRRAIFKEQHIKVLTKDEAKKKLDEYCHAMDIIRLPTGLNEFMENVKVVLKPDGTSIPFYTVRQRARIGNTEERLIWFVVDMTSGVAHILENMDTVSLMEELRSMAGLPFYIEKVTRPYEPEETVEQVPMLRTVPETNAQKREKGGKGGKW